MSKLEKRTARRVAFEDSFETTVVAIDGSWSIRGRLYDVSDTGARVRLSGELIERLRHEEFILMITPDGRVSRRAKMVWERKQDVGVHFVSPPGKTSRQGRSCR